MAVALVENMETFMRVSMKVLIPAPLRDFFKLL